MRDPGRILNTCVKGIGSPPISRFVGNVICKAKQRTNSINMETVEYEPPMFPFRFPMFHPSIPQDSHTFSIPLSTNQSESFRCVCNFRCTFHYLFTSHEAVSHVRLGGRFVCVGAVPASVISHRQPS